jgi:hypothetical protein
VVAEAVSVASSPERALVSAGLLGLLDFMGPYRGGGAEAQEGTERERGT